METKVYSEIGRLRKVMVHAPGREIDVIVPESANVLLFEDILFGELARSEHEMMCKVFKKYGVDVVEIKDLLTESLKSATEAQIDGLLDELRILEHLSPSVIVTLKTLQASALASALIEGILLTADQMDDQNFYLLRPIPNLLFARDPVIVAYDKILASSMAEPVRRREAMLMSFIFTHHQTYQNRDALIDLHDIATEGTNLTLEGGDFLVLNETTAAIAWSKRTSLKSIRVLAGELKKLGIINLIVAKLPPVTSFIHLDTVFTRINHDECLIYPPLFAAESDNRARIIHFDLTHDMPVETECDTIFVALEKSNINLKPIYCGGKHSLIVQKREQWTQGSNAFCIAPGVILTYSRNVETIKELQSAGYMCVNAQEVVGASFEARLDRKTVILLNGEELCRARGGPRCLTHPLLRDPIA